MKPAQCMAVFASGLALGLMPGALANVTGPEAQNFNATTGGIDFVTVQSTETLEPGVLNLGFFLNQAVNTLPVFADEQSQTRTKYHDSLLMMDLNFGYGVWDGFEVGFSYPRLLHQKINDKGPRGQFAATGNTELRFMSKLRLFEREPFGGAFILSTNINRVKDNPYAGKNPKPTINAELAGRMKFGSFVLGANMGYRFKNPGEPIEGSPIEPTDDEYIASIAASYMLRAIDSKLIMEVFGSRPATKTGGDASARQRSSLEALAGLKHFFNTNLAFHAGAGTELIHGASSPDWRIYAGINWTTDVVSREQEAEVTESFSSRSRRVRELPVQKGEIGINFGNIYFKSGSHTEILAGGERSLQKLVQFVQRPPVFTMLVVEGHTDSIGADAYNLDLSVKRAQTIRSILIKKYGLDGNKIQAKGFGEMQPIADNGNYQGRQKNRRVVFKVSR